MSVWKKYCATNCSTSDAIRTHKMCYHPNLGKICLTSRCYLHPPPLAGGGGRCRDFFVASVFCIIPGENLASVYDALSSICEDLFNPCSCSSLRIRTTPETIPQRWIPLNNLERYVRLNVM